VTTPDENDAARLPESFWEALRRDEPDPRELTSAYLRFLARRPAPVSRFLLLRWLAAGFALGWGVAFAATGDPLFGAGLPRRDSVPTPAPDTSAPVRVRQSRAFAPASASAALASEPEPPGVQPPASAAPSARSSLHGVLPERAAADPQWQRAASALRARDYAAAEGALRELETAGVTGDREAASLALAQVLLARGRAVEARARLERLRTTAGSQLVRAKADTLLAESNSRSDRSSSGVPVPQ
jgi:hypothetical protein